MISTLFSTTNKIPGTYIATHYGTEELRLRDSEMYGRTSDHNRLDMREEIAKAQHLGTERYVARAKAAAEMARVDSRIAYAYVMGIWDTIREEVPQGAIDSLLEAFFRFSDEVQYASFKFHMAEASGKQGYTLAWHTFLRYNPQTDAILAGVVTAARSL